MFVELFQEKKDMFQGNNKNTTLSHFRPTLFICTPWKHQKISGVFKGYREGVLAWKGLMFFWKLTGKNVDKLRLIARYNMSAGDRVVMQLKCNSEIFAELFQWGSKNLYVRFY